AGLRTAGATYALSQLKKPWLPVQQKNFQPCLEMLSNFPQAAGNPLEHLTFLDIKNLINLTQGSSHNPKRNLY
ncbi:MAG: hypothetical protein V8Q93_10535, partial [Blautia faecis]